MRNLVNPIYKNEKYSAVILAEYFSSLFNLLCGSICTFKKYPKLFKALQGKTFRSQLPLFRIGDFSNVALIVKDINIHYHLT